MTQFKCLQILYKGFATLESWFVGGPHAHLVLRTTDSVTGILHDIVNHRVLLVRQRRAAMIREDNPDGFITEAVAGRFDIELGPKALFVKEALEEAGVRITEKDVELLNEGKPLAISAGILTEMCYLAYVPISPKKITGSDTDVFGVKNEGEEIQRLWIHEDDLFEYNCEDVRVFALIQIVLQRMDAASVNLGFDH